MNKSRKLIESLKKCEGFIVIPRGTMIQVRQALRDNGIDVIDSDPHGNFIKVSDSDEKRAMDIIKKLHLERR